MSTCKSCGRDIRWAKTERGKFVPFDARPVALGSHVLIKDFGAEHPKPVRFEELGLVEGCAALDRFNSHFATCPAAAQHRRPRGA